MATPTKVDVCNMALAHCGTRVGFMETMNEESAEGQLCRRYVDDAIREVLYEFPWPFALKIVTWTYNDGWRDDSTEEPWAYVYNAQGLTNNADTDGTAAATGPEDGVDALTGDDPGSFLDFIEFVDTEKVRHTYRKIDYQRRGGLVLSDHGPTAIDSQNVNRVSAVVLTFNDSTVAPGWDAHFAYAVALNLASKICGPLGAPQMRPFLIDAYSKALADAVRNAGNSQENILPPPDSEVITERMS